jgi:hypothetical protein
MAAITTLILKVVQNTYHALLQKALRENIEAKWKDNPLMKVSELIRNDCIAGEWRKHYVRGMILATAQAKCMEKSEVAAIEFGTADGDGLLNLCSIAQLLGYETGMTYRIFGFDKGSGLPAFSSFKDHPEIWHEGQFKMRDLESLKAKLPDFAKIIIGDVKDTVKAFMENQLNENSPLGFVAVDLDYYSSTKPALDVLRGAANNYIPAVTMYFDDVELLVTNNSWCGEALAINEFNDENEHRKIEKINPSGSSAKSYCCHILDHPLRTGIVKPLHAFEININNYL